MSIFHYHNPEHINKIADVTRKLTGTTRKLKVQEMGNFLENTELKERKVPVVNGCMYVKYFDDITPYRNGTLSEDGSTLTTNHTLFPLLTYEDGTDYQNFHFFGWFKDEECTQPVDNKVLDGSAYAKFLILEFLHTNMHALFLSKDGADTTVLRNIFPIHDLQLSSVGFYMKRGENEKLATSTSVNTALYMEIFNTPKLHTVIARQYFEHAANLYSYSLTGVPVDAYDSETTVACYIKTRDNTEMRGIPCCMSTNDSINNIMKLPVVVNADHAITSFSIDVSFDSTAYTFEGISNQHEDLNNVEFTDNGFGVIHISGEFSSEFNCILKSILSIKLKVIDASKIPDICTAKITNQSYLCNDKVVSMNIPDLFCRQIRYTYNKENETESIDTTATQSETNATAKTRRKSTGILEINNATDDIEDVIDFSETVQKAKCI